MVLNSEKQIAEVSDCGVAIQSHGDNNITINQGCSYSDVVEISRDVIRTELEHYSCVALEKVIKRLEYIEGLLIKKLATTNDGREKILQEPNAQYSFRNAILGYVRTGNEYLGSILVELISERLICEERSLLQIATDNAINKINDITNTQIQFLTLIFSLKYSKLCFKDVNSFVDNIEHIITKYFHVDELTTLSFYHLESVGLISREEVFIREELLHCLFRWHKENLALIGIVDKNDTFFGNIFNNSSILKDFEQNWEQLGLRGLRIQPAGMVLANVNLFVQDTNFVVNLKTLM